MKGFHIAGVVGPENMTISQSFHTFKFLRHCSTVNYGKFCGQLSGRNRGWCRGIGSIRTGSSAIVFHLENEENEDQPSAIGNVRVESRIDQK